MSYFCRVEAVLHIASLTYEPSNTFHLVLAAKDAALGLTLAMLIASPSFLLIHFQPLNAYTVSQGYGKIPVLLLLKENDH